MSSRYLTKSKFLLAMECPTKLYYQSRPDEYQSNNTEDAFLKALAKAGYQVGELAKCYYRAQNPYDLAGLSDSDALEQTVELLKKNEVVIFEAAIGHGNMFVRTDILVKNGKSLKLVEVKSSKWDVGKDSFFMKKEGIYEKWLIKIYDVAFQKYVLEEAYPDLCIAACLGLMDKAALCATQGLNQKFRISRDTDGKVVITGSDSVTNEDLSKKLIIEKSVDSEIRYVNESVVFGGDKSFNEYINFIAMALAADTRIMPTLGRVCAECEFRVQASKLESGKKSGFEQCWREMAGFHDKEFFRPSVLDLWYYAGKDKLVKNGIYFLDQVAEDDIAPKNKVKANGAGLSRNERQLLQIEKAKRGSTSEYINKDELKIEIKKWKYPFHFIDFETASPAIPLDKGAHPYQGFALSYDGILCTDVS